MPGRCARWIGVLGTLTYEATAPTDLRQYEIIRDVLRRAGLAGADQDLPEAVKVRHGRNTEGKLVHYYLNFSGRQQSISYPSGDGIDLLTNSVVRKGQPLKLAPSDLAIVMEQ